MKKIDNYFSNKEISVSLQRKFKKEYFANLNEKNITDDKSYQSHRRKKQLFNDKL